MLEIIQWLKNMEQLAHNSYKNCAEHLKDDEMTTSFLCSLSDDEKDHFQLFEKIEHYLLTTEKKYVSDITIDEPTKDRLEKPLQCIIDNIKGNDITLENTIECIANAEFSEWNDIFLYVINTFKKDIREIQELASTIQAHEEKVETFLGNFPEHLSLYSKLKELPVIWEKKLLIVDDTESLRKLMKKIMGKFGNVEEAVNGQEALEKIKDNFFDVIVSDMSMPVLNGMDFYLKAVEIDPDIRNRFMFCSGNITPSIEGFLHEQGLKHIDKPFTIPKLQKMVQDIIDRNR